MVLKRTKANSIYVATFISALVAFSVNGLNDNSAPASSLDWMFFIVTSIFFAAVGTVVIGSLVVFRGQLSLKRGQQNQNKKA